MMEYTIVENFNIQGEERVQEFKEFLSANMNNSSLRAPIRSREKNETYAVSLRANLKDVITLESLFSKWSDQDKQVSAPHNQSGIGYFLRRLFNS